MKTSKCARILTMVLVSGFGGSAVAATIRVPTDHRTIQSAVDAASAGDTVLVEAGTYGERIRLKAGVTLRSAGDDTVGMAGPQRAEATVIDGGGDEGEGPGVLMAEGSTLDGFTVTNVGRYDDVAWTKHFATYGEEQSEEHIGGFGAPGIGVAGVDCTLRNNIVHHNGHTGIAIRGVEGRRCAPYVVSNICYRNMGGGIGSVEGSTAVIERNLCYENFHAGIGHDNASPLVVDNVCHGNVRAGIGISEGASPVVRRNKCYGNRRAGIGIRSGEETQPIVEHNQCYGNAMAGIGTRDEARPIIRHNRCFENLMAGIGVRDGARPVIEYNECYENGMAGIGSRLGAAPIVRNNRCHHNVMAGIGAREGARPIIEDNDCFANGMAGIGAQTDAAPVILHNRCYGNAMAGIGARLGARPVIVDNECFENAMAGIGSREGAESLVVRNRSHDNEMAGIGTQLGARAVIVDNESRDNRAAGIGVRSNAVAVIVGNRCIENRLVAIGVPDGATAYVHGNELLRTEGGAPPLVAIRGNSRAILTHNTITGGGVAGLLVQGRVLAVGNRFRGRGPGQGSAVWVWKGSTSTVDGNRFDGYRNAVNASESEVTATNNVIGTFEGPSIIVRNPTRTPRVQGNTAITANRNANAFSVDGDAGANDDNVVRSPDDAPQRPDPEVADWPMSRRDENGESFHRDNNSGRQAVIRSGPWKLVATYGKAVRYELYDLESDPEAGTDLSSRLENVTFRLRGMLELKEANEIRTGERGPVSESRPDDE